MEEDPAGAQGKRLAVERHGQKREALPVTSLDQINSSMMCSFVFAECCTDGVCFTAAVHSNKFFASETILTQCHSFQQPSISCVKLRLVLHIRCFRS